MTITFSFSGYGQNQDKTPVYLNTDIDFETRASDLVGRMTLEEKISQTGNRSDAIPRLDIKAYNWWNECLHGVARAGEATVFPQAIGMAASFDLEMMYEVATIISDEARAKYHNAQRNKNYGRYYGLTMWSPNVNIFRDPRWGRGHETYGEDPYLTGQMGMQFVKGLQGSDSKYLKVVATPKHYAVHNGPEADRHHFNAVPDARDLWETYLPAFHDVVVKSKAYSIMGAYNRVDGESASASWLLLQTILREKWNFEGYVVSDHGAIRDIYANHKIVNTPEEAAAIGIRKGCDLNCGTIYKEYLKNAVELGLIDEDEINLAVYRLMLARMKLGMFDADEKVPYAQIPYEINNSIEHDEAAYKMAQKSMTLLKNDGTLPLDKKKINKIAVIGPNANSLEALRGNYYGEFSHPVSVLAGLKKKVGDKATVMYHEGCPLVHYHQPWDDYQVIEAKYLSTTDDKGNTVKGLTGKYYNGIKMQGEPVLERVDEIINFDWWEYSPTKNLVSQGIMTSEEGLKNDAYSARWKGILTPPETGIYRIGAASDDGCNVFIDGEKIAEGWYGHAHELFMGNVELIAGKEYEIVVEYYEASSVASISLLWEIPNQPKSTWNDEFEPSNEMLADVKQADVAIFVGGLDATWEGEEMDRHVDGFLSGDRTKIQLPGAQLKTIKAMQKTGTPTVVVLLAGSAISLNGLEEELSAYLFGWYPGQRGGDAVADVLFGDYNPAGRSPVTFYKSVDDLPAFENYNMTAKNGQTYRYFKGKPLFPFGHGLSYSEFDYSDIEIDKTTINDQDDINLSFKLKNTGKYNGEEVVQVYVKNIQSDKVMPVKQLREFNRISLEKGEEKTVEFTLNAKEDFTYYDAFFQRYMVEKGEFEIQVGASSEDIRLKQRITIE